MKIFEFIGLSLLCLMIVFGQVDSFIHIKLTLLLFVCGCITINLLVNRCFPVDDKIIFITLLIVTLGLILSFWGLINNNPGAPSLVRIHAVWPLLYLLLIAGISNLTTLVNISKTIVFSSFVVGSYGVIIFLVRLGYLPPVFDISDFIVLSSTNIGLDFSIDEGFIKMNSLGINMMPYLMPFVLSYFILSYNSQVKICRANVWLIFVIAGLAVLTIISLRKAIMVVSMLAILITLIFNKFRKHNNKLNLNKADLMIFVLIISSFMFSVNYVYDFNIIVIIDNFISGFDFSHRSDDFGAYARMMQFQALRDGWLDHPWFGAGLGATAYGYGWVSSTEMPWAYELSYMALLYQTGLIGVALYALGVFWIFYYGLIIVREDGDLVIIMIPALTALLCFLIANATNPYLSKFEALWTIFYPIAIINYWLCRERAVAPDCI